MNPPGRLLVCFLLLGGAATSSAEDAARTLAVDEVRENAGNGTVAAAGFNPFGSIGISVRQTTIAESRRPSGDLSLPLLGALAGMVCIGVLIRKFLD